MTNEQKHNEINKIMRELEIYACVTFITLDSGIELVRLDSKISGHWLNYSITGEDDFRLKIIRALFALKKQHDYSNRNT